jgi:ribonuclease HI
MIVYTDGSALQNPGEGGWGFVAIIDEYTEFWIDGGEDNTTNNRMELNAVIEALLHFPQEQNITICSDSLYVINCATGLWKKTKNLDLWEKYEKALNNRKLIWKKVKGHSGDKYNDIADELATNQAKIIKKNKKYIGNQ